MFTLAQFPLPKEHKGRSIKNYIPYVMSGDLTISAANIGIAKAFPDGTFYLGIDMPMFVTKCKPSVVTLDINGAQQADPNIGDLKSLVQLTAKLLGASRDLTAVPTRLASLVDGDDAFWNWDYPLVIEGKSGFIVNGINNVPSASAAGGIRLQVAFHGVLFDLG